MPSVKENTCGNLRGRTWFLQPMIRRCIEISRAFKALPDELMINPLKAALDSVSKPAINYNRRPAVDFCPYLIPTSAINPYSASKMENGKLGSSSDVPPRMNETLQQAAEYMRSLQTRLVVFSRNSLP